MKLELWKIVSVIVTVLGAIFGVAIKGFNLYNKLENRVLYGENKTKDLQVRMEKVEARCENLSAGLNCKVDETKDKISETNNKINEVYLIVKNMEGYLEGMKQRFEIKNK